MAAIEVVDLLSSPPVVIECSKSGPRPFTRRITEKSLTPPQTGHVLRPIQNEPNLSRQNTLVGSVIYISDDDENNALPIVKVVKAATNKIKNGSMTERAHPKSANEKSYSFWTGSHRQSLNDTDLAADAFADPFDKHTTTLSLRDKTSAERDRDFFYLSDDPDDALACNRVHPQSSEHSNLQLKPTSASSNFEPKAHRRSPTVKASPLKRTISDIGPPFRDRIMAKTSLKRSRTSIEEEEDPILFTSSPDVVRVARERREKARRERDAIMNEVDPIFLEDQHHNTKAFMNELSSDIDLPDLGSISSQMPAMSERNHTSARAALANYNNAKKPSKSKANERTLKQREKLEAKAVEAERKRQLKEEKARNKLMAQDLARVNTLRTDKKISTPEMIVDIPTDFDQSLSSLIREILQPLSVECTEKNSPMPNVIRWRRKVEAKYNDEMGHWEPTPKHIKEEKHVLCHILADEFVRLVTADEGHDLEAHMLRIRTKFPSCDPIYLIEGLTLWMRKNRNVKNKQFTDAVRQQGNAGSQDGTNSQRAKKRKQQPEYINEDLIEDVLLKLQVMHGALIHHTGDKVESAQWIVVFTQHISTIPYRLQRMAMDTAFCMESGQVKPGENPADTFVKMLQEVTRITAPIAYGIAAEYPSVQQLIRGFEMNGRDILQNLKKSANKDGAITDRDIGKRISRRFYNIFMGTDHGSTDI